MAKENITAFNKSTLKSLPIFTSCATCYAHLKSYPELFKDESDWHAKALAFSQRVCEFSSYILENISSLKLSIQKNIKKQNIFYHDPCHLRFPGEQAKKIISEPRTLLKKFPGVVLKERTNGPECCGQGGLFNVSHPATSSKICKNLLANFFETEEELIITTTCSGCLIQFQEIIARQKNENIMTMHLAVLINNFINQSNLELENKN